MELCRSFNFFSAKKHPNFAVKQIGKMSKPKFKISCEAQNGTAVIRIDGNISEWYNSASVFKSQVDTLIENGVKNAKVYINSGGGDVFQADEIRNEILRFPGEIVGHLGALCASAATAIACACNSVVAAKNVSYMIHKPMTCVSGNSDEVKADLKLLENKELEYAQMYADKTGLPIAKIQSMWIEDYWMNAEEAEKLGFIDQVEGDAEITPEDVENISAFKNSPKITATAKAPPTTQTQINNQISSDMRELLITMSGLPATATDVQLIAFMESLKSKAAKVDALQTQLTALQNSAIEEKAETHAEAAVIAKKITAAQKPFYKKNLLENFDETKSLLDAMPGLNPLSNTINKVAVAGSEDRSAWTYKDYQEKNPTALAALAKDDEPHFKVLFEAHYKTKLS